MIRQGIFWILFINNSLFAANRHQERDSYKCLRHKTTSLVAMTAYKCNTCKEKFFEKKDLSNHMHKKHGTHLLDSYIRECCLVGVKICPFCTCGSLD